MPTPTDAPMPIDPPGPLAAQRTGPSGQDRGASEGHRRRLVLTTAAALFVVLAATAVAVAVPSYERHLRQRCEATLDQAGFDGLVVHVDGSDVSVSGARSEAEAGAARELLTRVRGVGRVDVPTPADAAGVARTDPRIPVLDAELRAATLVVTGQVPSRDLKDQVLAAAGEAFGSGRVTDRVRAVDADVAAEARADVDAFAELIGQLPDGLLSGALGLHDRQLSLSGRPRSAGAGAALRHALATAGQRSAGLEVAESLRDVSAGELASARPSTSTASTSGGRRPRRQALPRTRNRGSGFGGSGPVAGDATETGRALDRRVQLAAAGGSS